MPAAEPDRPGFAQVALDALRDIHEPLDALRDIHEPLAPGWWPPAPGWWLVALLLAVVCIWGGHRLAAHWVRQRPYRDARARFRALHARRVEGLSARAFADAANGLLKDLLARVEGRTDVIRATGDAWRNILQDRHDDDAFSQSPGRLLGDDRFRRQVDDVDDELAALLLRTFDRLRPPARLESQARLRWQAARGHGDRR